MSARELLKEVVDWHKDKYATSTDLNFIVERIQEYLAKPEPEPFGFMSKGHITFKDDRFITISRRMLSTDDIPLYAEPPQRLSNEPAKPDPEPVAWRTHSMFFDKGWIYTEEKPTEDISYEPLYTEPPQHKPLSDDDFLQWLLTHQNDTHALNFANVDVSPVGKRWKLHGWVKKLKAVIEEFYGINTSVCTKQPRR